MTPGRTTKAAAGACQTGQVVLNLTASALQIAELPNLHLVGFGRGCAGNPSVNGVRSRTGLLWVVGAKRDGRGRAWCIHGMADFGSEGLWHGHSTPKAPAAQEITLHLSAASGCAGSFMKETGINRSLAHASGSVGNVSGLWGVALGQDLTELEASARERFYKIKFQLSPAPGRWPDDSRKKLGRL